MIGRAHAPSVLSSFPFRLFPRSLPSLSRLPAPAPHPRIQRPKAGNDPFHTFSDNVLFVAAWWQLPPVKQTATSANPFEAHAANVRTIMNMFWTKDADAINQCIELTEAKRCQDEWLLAYIQECRDGRQTWDMYNFIHGYATTVVGSWLPLPPGETKEGRTYTLLCGNSDCHTLIESTWETERHAGTSWPDIVRQECIVCAEHRQLRARVRVTADDKRHLEPLFAKAPYLHPYNKPRYHALLLRAVQFANSEKRILLWLQAEDKPYKGNDPHTTTDALDRRRRQWLLYSDDQTGGMMGLMPLVIWNANALQ